MVARREGSRDDFQELGADSIDIHWNCHAGNAPRKRRCTHSGMKQIPYSPELDSAR